MSRAPKYAYLLANALPAPLPRPRAAVYRSYLQHIRLLTDPHLWNVLVPRFRKACEQLEQHDASKQNTTLPDESVDSVWSSERKDAALELSRQQRQVKRLQKVNCLLFVVSKLIPRQELAQLRAAVACHPHALTRVLEVAYAQRGPIRYQLIQVTLLLSL